MLKVSEERNAFTDRELRSDAPTARFEESRAATDISAEPLLAPSDFSPPDLFSAEAKGVRVALEAPPIEKGADAVLAWMAQVARQPAMPGSTGVTEAGIYERDQFHRNAGRNVPKTEYVYAEPVVAGMAQGHAMATGKPQFIFAHDQNCLGLMSGYLLNASANGLPVVVMIGVGSSDSLATKSNLNAGGSAGLHALATGSGAKSVYTLSNVESVPRLLSRAYQESMSGTPGPVAVIVPNDLMMAVVPKSKRKIEITPLQPATVAYPSPQAVNDIVDKLMTAKRPTLLLGNELWLNGESALKDVQHIANLVGARVYEMNPNRLLFPRNDELYSGKATTVVETSLPPGLAKADMVLGLGTYRDSMPLFATAKAPFSPRLGQFMVGTSPDLSINVSPGATHVLSSPGPTAKLVLAELRARMEKDPAFAEKANKRADAVRAENAKAKADERTAAYAMAPQLTVHPLELFDALSAALKDPKYSDRYVVMNEALSNTALIDHTLQPSDPKSYFTIHTGAIGASAAAGIGIHRVTGKTAIVFQGDATSKIAPQWATTVGERGDSVVQIVIDNTAMQFLNLGRDALIAAGHLSSTEFPPPEAHETQRNRKDRTVRTPDFTYGPRGEAIDGIAHPEDADGRWDEANMSGIRVLHRKQIGAAVQLVLDMIDQKKSGSIHIASRDAAKQPVG